MRIDDGGGGAVVVDLDIAAVERRPPLRIPEVLQGAVDAPHRGQLDVRSGVVYALGDPPPPGVVVVAVDLERAGRARAVAGSSYRVAALHGERVALHPEYVVDGEAGGDRASPLVGRMTVEDAVRRPVIAPARVVQCRRDLRIAPGLVDPQGSDDVRCDKAPVVEGGRAEAQLAHRHVRD